MNVKKVSILLPCLNESETLEKCIKTIKKTMRNSKYDWEIIVCDNNSTDDSRDIAKKNEVKVICEEKIGYGNTLIKGINYSDSHYLVMLDSDMSYNEKDIPKMLQYLDDGYDLVIGNRFLGNTPNDAFPLFHKTGSKILNLIANIFFNTKVKDFHCGLRAFKREKILKLNLQSPGMEFASEMVIKAKLNKLKIKQFNTDYKKDERGKKSHLRTIRDGFRHLFLIFKIKWDTSCLIRYIVLFFSVLVFLICLFLTIISCKNDNVNMNVIKSLDYYNNSQFDGYLFNQKNEHLEYFVDYATEIKNLSLVYLVNPNKPINSMIEMYYFTDPDNGVNDYSIMFREGFGNKQNYSRYWHGQVVYLGVLLSFFTIDKVYIINTVILFTLFVILLFKVFRLDKKLFIAILVSFFMVNIIVIPFSTEFYFSFVLTILGSILVVDFYKKQKDIDYLLLVLGMLTCFFDFLTTETLTLTVPLFIYIYLNKNRVSMKKIMKYIFLWGISYTVMFLIKWGISYLYFGSGYLNELFSFASVRIIDSNNNYFSVIMAFFIRLMMYIFPFNLTSYSIVLSTILVLTVIYVFIFEIKNKEDFKYLILISIIPIIRFLALSSHSYFHAYFTYRAVLPILMTFILILIELKNVKKSN